MTFPVSFWSEGPTRLSRSSPGAREALRACQPHHPWDREGSSPEFPSPLLSRALPSSSFNIPALSDAPDVLKSFRADASGALVLWRSYSIISKFLFWMIGFDSLFEGSLRLRVHSPPITDGIFAFAKKLSAGKEMASHVILF